MGTAAVPTLHLAPPGPQHAISAPAPQAEHRHRRRPTAGAGALRRRRVLLAAGAGGYWLGSGDAASGNQTLQLIWFGLYGFTALQLFRAGAHALRSATGSFLVWSLIALAVVSLAWSTAPGVSVRRLVALLGSSIVGLYLANRYRGRDLYSLLLLTTAIGMVLSLAVVLLLPSVGISTVAYESGWRASSSKRTGSAAWPASRPSSGSSMSRAHTPAASSRSGGLVLSVIMLLGSGSKTALLVTASLLLITLMLPLFRLHLSLAIPLFLGLLAGGAVAVSRVLANAEELTAFIGRDLTLTGRTEIWDALTPLAAEHPWLGYGYGGFWLDWSGPSRTIWTRLGWQVPNAHNGFLDLRLELGYIGLTLFLLSFVVNLARAIALSRSMPAPGPRRSSRSFSSPSSCSPTSPSPSCCCTTRSSGSSTSPSPSSWAPATSVCRQPRLTGSPRQRYRRRVRWLFRRRCGHDRYPTSRLAVGNADRVQRRRSGGDVGRYLLSQRHADPRDHAGRLRLVRRSPTRSSFSCRVSTTRWCWSPSPYSAPATPLPDAPPISTTYSGSIPRSRSPSPSPWPPPARCWPSSTTRSELRWWPPRSQPRLSCCSGWSAVSATCRGGSPSPHLSSVACASALLVLIAITGHEGLLTAPSALLILAIASVVGAAAVTSQHGASALWRALTPTPRGTIALAASHWRYGRWLAATSVLALGSIFAQTFLTAAIIDVEAAGTVRALQLFTLPLIQLITAVGLLGLPALSRDFAARRHAQGLRQGEDGRLHLDGHHRPRGGVPRPAHRVHRPRRPSALRRPVPGLGAPDPDLRARTRLLRAHQRPVARPPRRAEATALRHHELDRGRHRARFPSSSSGGPGGSPAWRSAPSSPAPPSPPPSTRCTGDGW